MNLPVRSRDRRGSPGGATESSSEELDEDPFGGGIDAL